MHSDMLSYGITVDVVYVLCMCAFRRKAISIAYITTVFSAHVCVSLRSYVCMP